MSENEPLPIVHINGFPGTGKLTIAKHIQQLLGDRCRLVHNHLLINPADAVLHRTEPGYQDLRRAIRGAVFKALTEQEATHGCVYLFTDFQSSDVTGSATCAEFAEAARARGCELVSVVLACDEEVNVQRLLSEDRAHQRKLSDAELLRSFRKSSCVHRFKGSEAASLELDVTVLSPLEAARVVLDHILGVCPALGDVLNTRRET